MVYIAWACFYLMFPFNTPYFQGKANYQQTLCFTRVVRKKNYNGHFDHLIINEQFFIYKEIKLVEELKSYSLFHWWASHFKIFSLNCMKFLITLDVLLSTKRYATHVISSVFISNSLMFPVIAVRGARNFSLIGTRVTSYEIFRIMAVFQYLETSSLKFICIFLYLKVLLQNEFLQIIHERF